MSRTEEIDSQIADSRLHFGPIRVRPLFGLRDAGYNSNVFGTVDSPVSDWGGTVSAGADLILPLGRKFYVLGIANPEYTWYDKIVSRRMLGGVYGGSLLGLFNHMSVEAGGTTAKTIAPVNSEVELSSPGRRTDMFAKSEIDLVRRFSVFGSAQQEKQRYGAGSEGSDVDPEQLERDETYVQGGLRYKPRSYLDFSLGVESGRAEFLNAAQNDNTTHAVIAGIHYDRPRFFLNFSGGTRRIEPRGVLSTFPAFSTTMGSYYSALQLGIPVTIDAYGHRNVVYSVDSGSRYFDEARNGLGATLLVGHRVVPRARRSSRPANSLCARQRELHARSQSGAHDRARAVT